MIKADVELLQTVFEKIEPNNLKKFFDKFYSKEELVGIFNQSDKLQGKLLKLSRLYNRDDTVLETLDFRLLDEKYSNIPEYKIQLIAKMQTTQEDILKLDPYKLSLYNRMTQLVSKKTNSWNRLEENILKNLTDGYYNELIEDLRVNEQEGENLGIENIESLTFLFSKKCQPQMYTRNYVLANVDDKVAEQLLKKESNNIFNITSKEELEHYEEIKEMICNAVLNNPDLDDEQSMFYSKYLVNIKLFSKIDRVKMVLLEKYYNMELKEAEDILSKFGTDIEEIIGKNEQQRRIIEQIKAIKNIFQTDNLEELQKIAELDNLEKSDLSISTYLMEKSKEIFEQKYKDNLYITKNEDRIDTVEYKGKKIEVFDANVDFQMIVKTIATTSENSQDIWNSLTRKGAGDNRVLRYYTCTSYMTDENLLKKINDQQVILGFSQSCNGYSFGAMYTHDAHTVFYTGDTINMVDNGKYMFPETLETNTNNEYNEIVINTLNHDENGNITKMQPDYIVYIKEKSQLGMEDIENDPIWVNSKRIASEFEIPIVMIDREKVMENEKNKIKGMLKSITNETSSLQVLKLVKKIDHYNSRYDKENIEEFVPDEKIELLRKEIQERKRIENEREENERKRKLVLSKKLEDFEYDYENDSYKNATEDEVRIFSELISETQRKIDCNLNKMGITSYQLELSDSGFKIFGTDEKCIEKIEEELQGKQHYKETDIMGDVVLDFELQEGEILFQFLERAEKYAMQFSKYYDGYNFNENIRFDKNGNAIGVSYIEKKIGRAHV